MKPLPDKAQHEQLMLVGLRQHATAIGLVQLTRELEGAGVLSTAAVAHVKSAIAGELLLACPRHQTREEYEASIHRRLDALFDIKDESRGN